MATLTNDWMRLEDVWAMLDALENEREPVALDKEASEAVLHCHSFLANAMARPDRAPIYGVNTGFGDLARTVVAADELGELQRRILISHACGVGEDVPEDVVRAMLLLKAKALCKGHSGVQLETVNRLLAHLNSGLFPIIPTQGSLGASGDLAPLAHMALPLIGEGEVRVDGMAVPSSDVLTARGWDPIVLGPKEGLALINGTQLMLAYGVQAIRRIERIAEWADAAAAWSLEAWHGRTEQYDPAIHRVRHQAGAQDVARSILAWLEGSVQQAEPRAQVQDPYSFRCVPQVHGASRTVLENAKAVIENEVNAVTDNPLIFPETGQILSGGNFHGQPLALQLDFLALAVHEWASISERRIFKLLSGRHGLPPFLSENPGLNSGFMIPQYTAASLVSQNKQLTTPCSADSIDSSNGQEDHVSMGANGALKLARILDNAEQVLACEIMTAAQAMDLRGTDGMAPRLAALQQSLRAEGGVPFLQEDAFLQPMMLATRAWMLERAPAERI